MIFLVPHNTKYLCIISKQKDKIEGKSLENNRGSKADPEGGQDFLPFSNTCCFLLERKHVYQMMITYVLSVDVAQSQTPFENLGKSFQLGSHCPSVL